VTRFRHGCEYRLVIPGHAVSFRSPTAATYKSRVRRLARSIFSRPITSSDIEVSIDYFHSVRRRVDADNVAKCILDALNRVAYVDDRQVRHQYATAHSIQLVAHLHEIPIDLVKPLDTWGDYVFVRVYVPRKRPSY
jgi:Holliday junction resolvase RusA-like endonuclease